MLLFFNFVVFVCKVNISGCKINEGSLVNLATHYQDRYLTEKLPKTDSNLNMPIQIKPNSINYCSNNICQYCCVITKNRCDDENECESIKIKNPEDIYKPKPTDIQSTYPFIILGGLLFLIILILLIVYCYYHKKAGGTCSDACKMMWCGCLNNESQLNK